MPLLDISPAAKRVKASHSKVLECRLCATRYSLEQILNGEYILETMICGKCYAGMQHQPHEVSCFGKPTFVLPNGKRLLGYDPEAKECSRFCPDRAICARIVMPEPEPEEETV